MDAFYPLLLFNTFLPFYSYKFKKLTFYGSVMGFILGLITLMASSVFYVMLIAFFLSSSKLTKMGSKIKIKISSNHKVEKVRGVYQVLCNGGVPTILAFFYFLRFHNELLCIGKGGIKDFLIISILTYYATCNGDTWASEVGVLNSTAPFLITNFQQVPAGTNGGISLLGTTMSALGGLLIGLIGGISQIFHCNYSFKHFIKLTLIGLSSGIIGSLIDSILGAILQESIYNKVTKQIITREEYLLDKKEDYVILGRNVLTNNMVNFISATITSILFGIYYI